MQGLNFPCIMSHSMASINRRGRQEVKRCQKMQILLCVICGCFLFAQHDVYIFLYKLIPRLTVYSIFSIYIYTRSHVLLRVCISESKTSSVLSILSKKIMDQLCMFYYTAKCKGNKYSKSLESVHYNIVSIN